MGVFVVGRDEAYVSVAKRVHAPSCCGGKGLRILAPCLTVELCSGHLPAARNRLFFLLIARWPVAFGDVDWVKLLVAHRAAFLRTSLHMEHVAMLRLRKARSQDS